MKHLKVSFVVFWKRKCHVENNYKRGQRKQLPFSFLQQFQSHTTISKNKSNTSQNNKIKKVGFQKLKLYI